MSFENLNLKINSLPEPTDKSEGVVMKRCFDLNEGQRTAHDGIVAAYNDRRFNGDRFCTLIGPAGSGKTTVLQDIIRDLPTGRVGMTAPTHKATKVCQRMAYHEGIDHRVDIRTIHSALGLTMKQKYGEEVLVREDDAFEHVYDVLIIDECSMLDDEMIGYIIGSKSKFIIFVGDMCQISPVNNSGAVSSTFTQVELVFKLNEVVRQAAENPIIKLATRFRENQFNGMGWPAIYTERNGDHGVLTLDNNKFIEYFLESLDHSDDPDYCRAIAYTNKQVNLLNDIVHKHRHGDGAPDWVVGDIIVANSSGDKYKNAEECRIMSVTESFDNEYEVPCWELSLESLDDIGTYEVKIVSMEYAETFAKRLSNVAEQARQDKSQWRTFWGMKKKFGEFKRIYAMTGHKSQGSTFNKTFIYTPDFLRFGPTVEMLQLMYTGCTRSSEETVWSLN